MSITNDFDTARGLTLQTVQFKTNGEILDVKADFASNVGNTAEATAEATVSHDTFTNG